MADIFNLNLMGSVFKSISLLLPFLSFWVLSKRYEKAYGKKAMLSIFFVLYLVFSLAHLVVWETYILGGNLSAAVAGKADPFPGVFAFFLLFVAALLLYIGVSRLEDTLFSGDLRRRHFLTALNCACIASIVFFWNLGLVSAGIRPLLIFHILAWVVLATAYASQVDIYRKFRIRFAWFPYIVSVLCVANSIRFLATVFLLVPPGASLPTYYASRMISNLILAVGGLVASVPAFLLLKELLRMPAISEAEAKDVCLFAYRYCKAYAGIMGTVSQTILNDAITSFGRSIGKKDFDISQCEKLPPYRKVALLEEILRTYKRFTGPVAEKMASEILLSSAEFSSDPNISVVVRRFVTYSAMPLSSD